MPADTEAGRQCIARCIQLRNEGKSEAVLRSEFLSWLRRIFTEPEDVSWVNHYSEGAEAGMRVGLGNGTLPLRFIDNLVRATTIEYESDLRQRPRFETGYQQVKEHVAGAIRSGTPVSQVRGVLSDTVEWHVYDVSISEGIRPEDCTPDDISLHESEVLRLAASDRNTASGFIRFLQKHLGRQQSRHLTPEFITTDLGLDSMAFSRHVQVLTSLVEEGRRNNPSARLVTDLWSQFVDLEHDAERFRATDYVDEVYLAILARLLSANVLERHALMSEDNQLSEILTGQYFEDRFHLRNFVEQDYFAWLWRTHLSNILPVAAEIQRDLYAYDFSIRADGDLFGRLMAQLARRTQRKLLGQEATPQWVARQISRKCIDMIPRDEPPRIVDMCCGSGAIISEALKYVRESRPNMPFSELSESVSGFDIDPLAVQFAKTTWVVTLADEVRASADPVTIPVYHADSLFAVTPTSRRLPLPGESGTIAVQLDGGRVNLPLELIAPEYRPLFDDVIDWCYDEARDAQRTGSGSAITRSRVAGVVDALIQRHKLRVDPELKRRVQDGIFDLVRRMADLAIANRNGIWAFILRNTYRPALLTGQFNGLISNPPWLAMSQFANNPYKEQLSARAQAYGIKPGGAAHLHLDLATTHLLHAVDRYLKPGSAITCLVPGTIFKAQNHAKFRDAAYLDADRPVPFELQTIAGVTPGTFKVRASVAIGIKRRSVSQVRRANPTGALVVAAGIQDCPLHVRRLGRRTAWVLGASSSVSQASEEDVPPEGADLMPRQGVCVEIVDRRGTEWSVRTPQQRDRGYFAVKGAKKLQGRTFSGSVAPQFIYRMVQSLNLLPFKLDENFTHIAIPARRTVNGQWEMMSVSAIRTAGYTQTARRFERINAAMGDDEVVRPLHEKINERNKLSIQVFPSDKYLIVNGAGGGVACAACLPVSKYTDIVVDQTLYWTLASSEQEAWYKVGLMNTDALTDAIREFNPEGELGPRHLHTLPNRVIPVFDETNDDHVQVAELAQQLSEIAEPLISGDEKISDPIRPIAARRRRLRRLLKESPVYAALEHVSASVLGIRN